MIRSSIPVPKAPRFVRDGVYQNRYAHGRKPTREYASWTQMKYRCGNPKCKNYLKYGGRGIRVCEEWKSFDRFYADMGPRPEGTSLDRIDNNGNYEPGNCRWATHAIQMANRRCTVWVEFNGEKNCIRQWALKLGLGERLLLRRYRKGTRPPELFARPDPEHSRTGMDGWLKKKAALEALKIGRLG